MPAQVALITGASRGIGRGIAIELARAGFSIAINYASRKDAALECKRRCESVTPPRSKAEFLTFQADISKRPDRTRLLESALKRFGWIDLLVNNAGVAPLVREDMLSASEQSFDRLMSINARGPFFLTQALANVWTSAGNQERTEGSKPKIVNISSVSAFAPGVTRGEYCMSKAAFSMMTQLYAVRLAEFGINVYEIRPGVIDTDMTAAVRDKYESMISKGLSPIRRWGTPTDVGRAVTAIALGQFPFSTGEVINVDGGFHIRKL